MNCFKITVVYKVGLMKINFEMNVRNVLKVLSVSLPKSDLNAPRGTSTA